MQAIKTSGLEYTYKDGATALAGVDFEAKAGERIAILGPNGSGKTTLFYHFNGLLKPTRGKVKVFGENISSENMDAVRKRVGLVFQDPDSQLFAPTVREDIAFGPRNLRLCPGEIENRVREALRRFNIEDLALRNPANLSGGQKKRVAIAGVVAMEPDVLVLDEPTSGLDACGVAETMEILDELNGEGKTVILSTHDSELAASWADRIYILNRGKVFKSGAPEHIFADENLLARAGLRHPVVVQTYREFQARGLSKGEVPLSVLELMDSIDIEVMSIRCAVAGCSVSAGDEVCLEMKDGMLYAHRGSGGVRGKAVFDGKEGEDIAVRDVAGDLRQLSGSITVVRVPGIAEGGSRAADAERARGILGENKRSKVGAMGTSAKVLLRRMDARCDFEFDVVQSSMLAALRGFNVVVFASGGMAERVVEKVRQKKIKCSCFVL